MGGIRKCDDFADEYDHGGNESQWYNFRRQAWGGIHAYMADQIQVLWSRAHRDVLAKLNLSCELSRDAAGTQLNRLRGVQGQLDGVVEYLAKLWISN